MWPPLQTNEDQVPGDLEKVLTPIAIFHGC